MTLCAFACTLSIIIHGCKPAHDPVTISSICACVAPILWNKCTGRFPGRPPHLREVTEPDTRIQVRLWQSTQLRASSSPSSPSSGESERPSDPHGHVTTTSEYKLRPISATARPATSHPFAPESLPAVRVRVLYFDPRVCGPPRVAQRAGMSRSGSKTYIRATPLGAIPVKPCVVACNMVLFPANVCDAPARTHAALPAAYLSRSRRVPTLL
jgi:hypothetical protein